MWREKRDYFERWFTLEEVDVVTSYIQAFGYAWGTPEVTGCLGIMKKDSQEVRGWYQPFSLVADPLYTHCAVDMCSIEY